MTELLSTAEGFARLFDSKSQLTQLAKARVQYAESRVIPLPDAIADQLIAWGNRGVNAAYKYFQSQSLIGSPTAAPSEGDDNTMREEFYRDARSSYRFIEVGGIVQAIRVLAETGIFPVKELVQIINASTPQGILPEKPLDAFVDPMEDLEKLTSLSREIKMYRGDSWRISPILRNPTLLPSRVRELLYPPGIQPYEIPLYRYEQIEDRVFELTQPKPPRGRRRRS